MSRSGRMCSDFINAITLKPQAKIMVAVELIQVVKQEGSVVPVANLCELECGCVSGSVFLGVPVVFVCLFLLRPLLQLYVLLRLAV